MPGALVLLLCGVLVGCGALGERYPRAAELRADARSSESSGYTYGYGSGETPEQARQSALYEIAGEVATAVRGEQREQFRALERRGEMDHRDVERMTEIELTATVASLSQVAVEGAEVVAEQRSAEGWHVAVRVAAAQMHAMRTAARRNAPALAQFELVEALPAAQPGLRFIRAGRGLESVERLGLGSERLYRPGEGVTTFATYFETVAREAVAQLQALPVVEDRAVRFVVVDRESLAPQPNLALRIAGRNEVTDRDGWTSRWRVDDFSREIEVVVVGESRRPPPLPASARRVDLLDPSEWRRRPYATLYLHTHPTGAVVTVNGADHVTPARVAVRTGRELRLRVFGGASYRGTTAQLRVDAETPAVYFTAQLSERHYGDLDLAVDGRSSVLRLDSHGGEEGATIRRAAEAGRYRVRVTRNSERYQEVVDTFVLPPDERIQRRYREPRDRQPFHYGWRWGVTLAVLGGEPDDHYRLPGSGERVRYGDGAAAYPGVEALSRQSELNAQFGLQGQYYANRLPLTAAVGLGYRVVDFDIDDGALGAGAAEVSLETFQLTLGGGVWWPMGPGNGWLTVNQAWESGRWDDEESTAELPGGTANNRFSFLELGGQFDLWLVALRIAERDGGLAPLLLFGFGGGQLERGYRYPAQVPARPGVHYE